MVSEIDVIGSDVGEISWRAKVASEPNVLRRAQEFRWSIEAYVRADMAAEGKEEVLKAFEFVSNYPDKWARMDMQCALVGAMARLGFHDDAFSLAEKIEDAYGRDSAKGGIFLSLSSMGFPTWAHYDRRKKPGEASLEIDLPDYKKNLGFLAKALKFAETIEGETERNNAFGNLANDCILFGRFSVALVCLGKITDSKIYNLYLGLVAGNISIVTYPETAWKFSQMGQKDWKSFARLIRLIAASEHHREIRKMPGYAKIVSKMASDSPKKQREIYSLYDDALSEAANWDNQMGEEMGGKNEIAGRSSRKIAKYDAIEVAGFIKKARESQNVLHRVSDFVESISWCDQAIAEEGRKEVLKEFEFATNYPDRWVRVKMQGELVNAMIHLQFYDDALSMAEKIEDKPIMDEAKHQIAEALVFDGWFGAMQLTLEGDEYKSWLGRTISNYGQEGDEYTSWLKRAKANYGQKSGFVIKALQIVDTIAADDERNARYSDIARNCVVLGRFGIAIESYEKITDAGIKESCLDSMLGNMTIEPHISTTWHFALFGQEDWSDFARLIKLMVKNGHALQVWKAFENAETISQMTSDSPEKQKEIYTRYKRAFLETNE